MPRTKKHSDKHTSEALPYKPGKESPDSTKTPKSAYGSFRKMGQRNLIPFLSVEQDCGCFARPKAVRQMTLGHPAQPTRYDQASNSDCYYEPTVGEHCVPPEDKFLRRNKVYH